MTPVRSRWRRLRFGLATVLGAKRLGFFIPYRYAGSVEPGDYPALRPLFAAAEPGFAAVLSVIEDRAADLRRILETRGGARFDQDWFPRLDAAAAYALIRELKPRRIVEVGSGHSTRFMARAVADGGLDTQITCIDPAPRASLSGLGVHHVPLLLKDSGEVFTDLREGDVLFVDSSHVALPGTDVDRLFLDVVPRLPKGVLIHVHDVTLPEDYPAQWAWRGYNEQLLVAALLVGGGFELVFASHYVAKALLPRTRRGILSELPLLPGALETSLWLRKL